MTTVVMLAFPVAGATILFLLLSFDPAVQVNMFCRSWPVFPRSCSCSVGTAGASRLHVATDAFAMVTHLRCVTDFILYVLHEILRYSRCPAVREEIVALPMSSCERGDCCRGYSPWCESCRDAVETTQHVGNVVSRTSLMYAS
ncbi:hypothetical protein RIF29_12113 [Crotalaria pallida]|uniref:Secreted protein n=1 Tax=Crotalaria pallida TaxID=3830 RepID=A0AAN9IMZ7_CROPI